MLATRTRSRAWWPTRWWRVCPVPARDLPWDLWLGAYHDALWKQLRRYPGVAHYLLEHPSTPAGAAVRRVTVEVFIEAGFDDRTALLATSTFHTLLLGRLAVHALGTGRPTGG